ncbi:MAG: ATP-binding cassette domain-containing protein [Firmicutes bacterium]|nr:ATP-binding cassette domain-containing protein [Bacillota bacterium]
MLELKDICLSVDDGKEILKNINLEIPDGKFIVITGPNGGGKSTLARVIAGILEPKSGKILLDNEDITDKTITERAKMGIGFAFQQPVRFKGITVHDLITLAAGKKLSLTETCDYLGEVGLCAKDYVTRDVDASLSGGELKRIEIAGILARKSRISLFDEPEAGIDLWSFKNLISVFEKIHDEIKGSIVIISHQERILDIADEIIVIADGEIRKRGSKDEILPELLSAGDNCKFY